MPQITHMLFVRVRALSELQLFAALNVNDICHHHSGTDMVISMLYALYAPNPNHFFSRGG